MNSEETLWSIDKEEYHLWPPCKHCGNDMVFATINEETEDIVERLCEETLHYREVKDGAEPTGFCEPYSESWVKHCWFDQGHQYLNWDYFSQKVKHSLRFFDADGFNRLDELEKLDDFFEDLSTYIISNEECFRSRIVQDPETLYNNPKKELGIAPLKFVGHNRFSPSGISYMYLAFDPLTAVSEVRNNDDDIIYTAKFLIDESVQLLNLTNTNFEETSDSRTDPFYEEYDTYYACGIELLKAFIQNIQNEITEDSKPLEYIPTQILAEFIRLNQYDGFVFDSTKNNNGINIVLFDDTKVTYQTYKQSQG